MKLARSAGTSALGAVLALWYVFKNRSVVMTGPSILVVDALRIEPPVEPLTTAATLLDLRAAPSLNAIAV
jgi:hypothetical protein